MPLAMIGQPEPDDLDRIISRDKNPQILLQPVRYLAPVGVTGTMPDFAGGSPSGRSRCRRPYLGRFFVAQIERLARLVHHRVVGPRRNPILAAIARPAKSAARFRHHRTKAFIGQDVDPGRGGGLARLQIDDIFPPIRLKAAKTIVAQKIPGTDQLRDTLFVHRLARGFKMRQFRRQPERPGQLLFEAAGAILDDDPGNRFDQPDLVGPDLVGEQQVDPAVPAQHPLGVHVLQQVRQIVPHGFDIARCNGLQDDQINLQPLPAPQLMRADQVRQYRVG